jgi:hypothetical protein
MLMANMGVMPSMPSASSAASASPASFLRRIVSSRAAQPKAAMDTRSLADGGESDNLNIPGFLRRGKAAPGGPVEAAPAAPAGREQALRALARAQKLDGSWNNDVEWTAAALLAFLRAGHTTRTGDFRPALRKAVRWLVDAKASGMAAFARALALRELASATGDAKDQSAADSARASLPAPSTPLEEAALGNPVPPPAAIRTLDDLRLAAVVKARLPVPKEVLKGVGEAWAAAV